MLHLTPILFGVGFLWQGVILRWSAALLIVGALSLAIGVGTADALSLRFYSLFSVSLLIALAPIGLRYLVGESKEFYLELATA